jgi:hypothetical protein
VAQALDLEGSTNTAGAPLLAHFAKDGNPQPVREPGSGKDKALSRQHRTRRCKMAADPDPSSRPRRGGTR